MKLPGRAAIVSAALAASTLLVRAQNQAASLPDSADSAKNQSQSRGQMNVICSGDQLTISANGSPLSTILAEVSRCSGAKIDGSETAARMRSFETIGPAPIQQVLASLLDATGINYVIQVSDNNPRKVATVILLARAERANGAGSADDSSTSGGRRAFLRPMQQNSKDAEESARFDQPTTNADAGAAGARSEDASDSVSPAPENPQATAARVPAAGVDSAPASSQMNLQDRIADMQRMFEQRKQMLQDQNSHPR